MAVTAPPRDDLYIRVPPELRRALKVVAALQDKSANKLCEEYLTAGIMRDAPQLLEEE